MTDLSYYYAASKGDKLERLVDDFVRKHKISDPAMICDTDSIIVDAYKFIQDLCDVVGYHKYPEES